MMKVQKKSIADYLSRQIKQKLCDRIVRETNKMSRDLYKDFQKMFNPSEFKKTVK